MRINNRVLQGITGYIHSFVCGSLPIMTFIYVSHILPDIGIVIYKEQFLALFVTLVCVATFMKKSLRYQSLDTVESKIPIYDWILIVITLIAGLYTTLTYSSIIVSFGTISATKVIISIVGIVAILEATRRQVGFTILVLIILGLLYAFFGHNLAGIFQIRALSFNRIVTYNYLGSGAILGIPTFVAATIVTAFVLFGEVLLATRGGEAISNFALSALGRRRGGPAKVAVIASALFGSLSGSASANVATTGIITIPMMKKTGYSSAMAGAVEAVASTGGLILPPVMAATGFLMAEFLGVPYAKIAIAAAVPALLYYWCVYLQVDLAASKNKLKGLDLEEVPKFRDSLRKVLPITGAFAVLLFGLFFLYWDATLAGIAAAVAGFLTSLVFPWMRRSIGDYLKIFANTGESVVFITTLCAAAGLLVGILDLTGLAVNLATNIVSVAGDNLFLLLLISAACCIILGMGVPVTATYIILVVLIAPALSRFGVPDLNAHMFVFYFGTLSFITPPVCLAVFVATSIAKSGIMETAIEALKLAIVGYVIPFIFIFNGAFLFQGSGDSVLRAIIAGGIGVVFLAVGVTGYWRNLLGGFLRLAAIAVGILACIFGPDNWIATAIVIFLGAALVALRRRGKPEIPEG